MKLTNAAAVLLSTLVCRTLISVEAEVEINIIGGTSASGSDFPWYVTPAGTTASCGGSLIDPFWILTSASCLTAFSESDSVRLGPVNLESPTSGGFNTIARKVPHPGYNPPTNGAADDIMLIQLKFEATNTPTVAWEQAFGPADDEDLTIMGFGFTSLTGDPSPDSLQKKAVKAINIDTCNGPTIYNGQVLENKMFCAGVSRGSGEYDGVFSTHDEGGPIVNSASVQVGIASWGNPPSFPDVYTKVSAYKTWISNTMDNGVPIPKKPSRRRMLESCPTARSLPQDDPDYHKILEECGDFEYDVSLYVDPYTHLYVVSVPKDKQTAAKCPATAVHAVMSDKDKATKEILLSDDHSAFFNDSRPQDMISIGTFKLSDMAHAYEQAEPRSAGGSSFYDIVTNNCGSFLVNLAQEMHVKIDSTITSFVARRLLENKGQDLAAKIRNSLNFKSLFLGDDRRGRNLRSSSSSSRAEAATDEEIVHLLVTKTAAGGASVTGG